jgi:hypothetical protein
MITRKQYMDNSRELHEAYFSQFVHKGILSFVSNQFPDKAKLVESFKADNSFNAIPLGYWDNMTGYIEATVSQQLLKKTGEGALCLSTGVCIAKAAARMLVQVYEAEEVA